MLLPKTYLTAGVEATTGTPEATAEITTGTPEATAEITTTEGDTKTSSETDGTTSTELGEGTGEGAQTITMDENGNFVIVNPETGESTILTAEDLQDLGLMGDQSTQAIVQQPITGGISAIYTIYGIFCIGLIILVLSQNKRSAAFGNGMSSGNGETYWAKNKGRSKEGQIEFFTKIGIGIFIVATFILTLI